MKFLKHDESLFKNPEVFDIEHNPKVIKHRENEQNYLAYCVKPLLLGRAGRNIMIYGEPGIGKTLIARNVVKDLEDIKLIYINCWVRDTSYKIAETICLELGYKFAVNRKTHYLLKKAKALLRNKKAVFVFDEFDHINDYGILYFLLEEIKSKTIILISNRKEGFYFDSRIMSRLLLEELEFKPYSYNQIREILLERVKYGFVRNVLSKDAFDFIARRTFIVKDIRAGFAYLQRAGETAESKSLRTIKVEHAKEAVDRLKKFKVKSSKELESEKVKLLRFLRDNSGKSIKELFDLYQGQGYNKSLRTFYRSVSYLKEKKLV